MKTLTKIKNWIVNHLPTRRRIIQLYAFLLYNANSKGYIKGEIFKGNSKYVCVPGMNCYSCPGAVGACPLGALQNALNASGTTTAYYMFGIIALFGLIFARTICGFLCPVGLGQELLYKIKTPKLKKSPVTRILSYLKYVILVVLVIAVPIMYSFTNDPMPGFCKYICPAGTFEGGLGLLLNKNNWPTGGLLDMLGPIFTWKFCVLMVIIVGSVFAYRPFCRWICPLGAIYGFFNRISLIGVKLDKNKCTDCGLCVAHCKMDVKHVGDHECINCGECISVCPVKAISWKGSKIFVRPNDIDTPVVTEEKPLVSIKAMNFTPAKDDNLVTAGAPANANLNAKVVMVSGEDTQSPLTAESTATTETAIENPVPETQPTSEIENPAPETQPTSEIENPAPETQPTSGGIERPKRKRGRRFWMEFAAWATAIVVLVTALVYFNVFATESQTNRIAVGEMLPDFSVEIFGEDEDGNYVQLKETFTASEHRGEVLVINFWATWCTPCVGELPSFDQIAEEYIDKGVKVIAIHGDSTDKVARFIKNKTDVNGKNWLDYKLTFAQDNKDGTNCLTYNMLGGNGTWPMTLIVDAEGKITFIRQGSLEYDKLKSEVDKALAK